MSKNYYDIRFSKLESWASQRLPRYPERFEKSHTCVEMKDLPDGASEISCAGRIIAIREMGKLTFAHIQDHTGRIQFALNVNTIGEDEYKFLLKHLDVGDYVGVRGSMFTTKKGERTLKVTNCVLLAKSLRPLPEKWHGLVDHELRARQRYLDLLSNEDTRQRFIVRNKVIKFIRRYVESFDFFEVDTPILQSASSGASARPFVTHHNALDIPLYLRIAPETYLKRLMVGGYERVYELGKCFRNEGIDASHLQEFTMLEYYAAYWNYRDNMQFIQTMIQEMVREVAGSLTIEYQGTTINFSGKWPEITYRDLVLADTGIDLDLIATLDQLKDEVRSKGMDLPIDQYVGLGSLIDALYKKFSRPKLIQPMFLTMHPSELVPLARRSDAEPRKLDMFQVLVNSWEVVKAYSELVDPAEQRTRLLEQRVLAEAGDEEAMMLEEDFILCMEYGMPPMSGLGLGVDRMITLLSNSKNIRDVIYFPSLRPIELSDVEASEDVP
ncbi:MAG TPA: lysine--tRNA ligase [Candidatus Wunengus sp. YC63]|uniref:lysine--tRNA ligase n=1 Tax=Candidatus Wunengus sp. YC63 TaxID=3367699 RepID=UPI002713F3AA|nr:lysine--tRNA ligase [Candidatus Brocadiales bacterium]